MDNQESETAVSSLALTMKHGGKHSIGGRSTAVAESGVNTTEDDLAWNQEGHLAAGLVETNAGGLPLPLPRIPEYKVVAPSFALSGSLLKLCTPAACSSFGDLRDIANISDMTRLAAAFTHLFVLHYCLPLLVFPRTREPAFSTAFWPGQNVLPLVTNLLKYLYLLVLSLIHI